MKIIHDFPNLLLLSVLALAFGCSSETPTGHPSNKEWYHPGITADQMNRDLAECQNEALAYGKSSMFAGEPTAARAIFDSMLESSREEKIVGTCMITKGYSLIDKHSPLLTNSQPAELETAINSKLLGHWAFIPPPEMPLRGLLYIYFLPNNRYKEQHGLIKADGQPLELIPSEEGRYYFNGIKLIQWADTSEKPDQPVDSKVTETQMTIQNGQWKFTFQKQAE